MYTEVFSNIEVFINPNIKVRLFQIPFSPKLNY